VVIKTKKICGGLYDYSGIKKQQVRNENCPDKYFINKTSDL